TRVNDERKSVERRRKNAHARITSVTSVRAGKAHVCWRVVQSGKCCGRGDEGVPANNRFSKGEQLSRAFKGAANAVTQCLSGFVFVVTQCLSGFMFVVCSYESNEPCHVGEARASPTNVEVT